MGILEDLMNFVNDMSKPQHLRDHANEQAERIRQAMLEVTKLEVNASQWYHYNNIKFTSYPIS